MRFWQCIRARVTRALRRLLIAPTLLLALAQEGCGDPQSTSVTELPAQPATSCRVGQRGRDHGLNRPNIVLVLTDDQRWDTLGHMPRVNAELVERGMRFANSFVNVSSCCPSRATILTGNYAHTTGVLRSHPPSGGATAFDPTSTVATWLHAAGYRTAYFGKYLNGYRAVSPAIPPGWDTWRVFASRPSQLLNRGLYYVYTLNQDGKHVRHRTHPSDYSTDLLRDMAVDFVESTAEPFFLVFAPFAPHRPAIPAPRHKRVALEMGPWRPPSYREQDLSDKPPWLQFVAERFQDFDTDSRLRVPQLKSLLAVDDAVGAIIDTLRRRDLLANTLIVYTSDNGYMWGEHALIEKGYAYEESMRVPLVIRFDGCVAPGTRSDALVANTDLAPTFARVAGLVDVPPTDGKSLWPLLTEATESVREELLGEYYSREVVSGGVPIDVNFRPSDYSMLRTREWKYVRYEDRDGLVLFKELYDMVGDPHELDNLVVTEPSNDDHRARAAELDTRLDQLLSTR
jgi:N-acetylglucosamine-6-sulfatase